MLKSSQVRRRREATLVGGGRQKMTLESPEESPSKAAFVIKVTRSRNYTLIFRAHKIVESKRSFKAFVYSCFQEQ